MIPRGRTGGALATLALGTVLACFGVGATASMAQTAGADGPFASVKTAVCSSDDVFALAIHGGTLFRQADQGRQLAFMERTLSEARAALAEGARALDVVEAAVVSLEDSGLFNAGKGAIANQAGVVELDASIMEGRLHKAGAVASVKAPRNPISAARLVMEKSKHVMMVGPDADRFVRENGGAAVDGTYFLHGGENYSDVPLPDEIGIVPPDDGIASDKAAYSGFWAGVWSGFMNHVFVVERIDADGAQVIYAYGPENETGEAFYERRRAQFAEGALRLTTDDGDWIFTWRLNPDDSVTAVATQTSTSQSYEATLRRADVLFADDKGGTVGAVARDRCGDLAAGTSTGGFGSKTPGRVGDSPIIGAGTYASNETAAISATGHGELFMRYVVAHEITAVMKYQGLPLEQAARDLIERDLLRKGLRGGVIAVDKDGNLAASYNTLGLLRGFASNELAPNAEAY